MRTVPAAARPANWRALAANTTFKGMSLGTKNVQDYKAQVSVFAFGNNHTSVSINYTKRNNQNPRGFAQSSTLTNFVQHGISVQIDSSEFKQSKDLKTGSVDSGNALGDRGKVKGSFTSNAPRKGRERKCRANYSRAGTFRGSVNVDAGGYLGEMTFRKSDAVMFSDTSFDKPACNNQPPPPVICPNTATLGASEGADSQGGFVNITKDLKRDLVSQNFFHFYTDGPLDLFDIVTATGPLDKMTFEPDLSSAQAIGIGPFFTGTMDFTADSVLDPADDPDCGEDQYAFGPITGDFTVNLDQSLDVEFATGENENTATLGRSTPS